METELSCGYNNIKNYNCTNDNLIKVINTPHLELIHKTTKHIYKYGAIIHHKEIYDLVFHNNTYDIKNMNKIYGYYIETNKNDICIVSPLLSVVYILSLIIVILLMGYVAFITCVITIQFVVDLYRDFNKNHKKVSRKYFNDV